jgi:hypothetical protein
MMPPQLEEIWIRADIGDILNPRWSPTETDDALATRSSGSVARLDIVKLVYKRVCAGRDSSTGAEDEISVSYHGA